MSTQQVTVELRRWVIEQAAAGHSPEGVHEALLRQGWSEETALAALEQTLGEKIYEDGPALALPEPDLGGSSNRLWAHDREVSVLLQLKSPRVVLFGNVLSDEECDELVALAGERLARSETVQMLTGASEVNAVRTSDGMFFQRGENALCERIERRLAALVNWPVENGEGLQVLRYKPGAQYLPHYDYFDPAQPGAQQILRRGGQRVGTLVLYLNTPARGGATTFPDAGLEIAPTKGHAAFFSYALPHPSSRSLHGGSPVVEGEKWVATKWMREGRFD